MGFLDKAKAQAQQLAVKAQEGVKTGQEKLEQSQARKVADGQLHDLGLALYLERTGRGTPETAGTVVGLVAQLQAYEAEHGRIDAPPPAPAPQTAPSAYGDPAAYAPPPAPAAAAPTAPPPPTAPPAPPAPAAPPASYSLDDL